MLLLSRFNAPALAVEPHIAAATYYDRQEELADEHEAQQSRAYETLLKEFNTSTPETWAKARTIGRARTSPDELLFDALSSAHEDKSVTSAFNALMCSEAAAELRKAVASFYADKYPEDFDHNSDGEKEFPHA